MQINEMKRLILSELSDLTDNSPTVYVTANPRTAERDDGVERAIQAFWQRYFVDLTILDVCADAAIWPCGFFEVPWDPLLAGGQGEIVVRARAPQTVFPDPFATSDEDWRYVVTLDVMDVNEVRQKWPDHGHRVRPDVAQPQDLQPFMTSPGRPSGLGILTPLYPISSPIPSGGMDTRVSVYSLRCKDTTLEAYPYEHFNNEGIRQLRRGVRYKYPQGRLVQCTADVVLYDAQMPYGDGFDLIQTLLQPPVHRFWPKRSLVAELLELQRAADKAESLTLENMLRLQKGLVLADANSGIDSRTFADIPGQVILKRPGSTVEIVRPPPLPPDLVLSGARYRSYMRELLGHQPTREGVQGRGNVSAELTETEITQAMGLTRLRARYLYKAVSRLVSKVLARMGQFYTHTRVLPYMQGQQWKPVIWEPLRHWEEYAAHVDPTSFAIQSKTMVKRLAVMLARIGRMASDKDLYDILEFPNGETIAGHNQEALRMAAQAAEAQRGSRRGR
jgi:CheY-like chemotaxis protein